MAGFGTVLARAAIDLANLDLEALGSHANATRPETVTGLVTLQFLAGGLLDADPVDGYQVHLVRCLGRGGTPGPTLCGIDRFHKDSPGWSVGGGVSGPGIVHTPCQGCAEVARTEYPGLAVTGVGAEEMAAVLDVGWSQWNGGRFRHAEIEFDNPAPGGEQGHDLGN